MVYLLNWPDRRAHEGLSRTSIANRGQALVPSSASLSEARGQGPMPRASGRDFSASQYPVPRLASAGLSSP